MTNETHSFGEVVEKIVIERNKKLNGLIFGEIQQIAKENGIDTKIVINEKTIISALEKQIPKKITHEATLIKCCTCPNCKNVVDKFERFGETEVRVTYRFCHFCGQALDWSDT